MVTAICEYCKELFTVQHNGQRYCNPRHRKIARGFRRDKGLSGEIKACEPVRAPLCSSDAGDVQLIQRAIKSWPEQVLPVLPPEIVEKFAGIALNDLTKTKNALAAAKVATSAFTAIHKVVLDHKKFERGDGSDQKIPLIDREAVKKWLDDDEANTQPPSTDGKCREMEDSPTPRNDQPEVNGPLPGEDPQADNKSST